MRESQRFLGLELAGAKNQKTALAVLEFYPKEKKVFLLDIFDRIGEPEDADQALLSLIRDFEPGIARIGVNNALGLPPCTTCTRKKCPLPTHCTVASVKWMRKTLRGTHTRNFTPYTQRPVELWIRHHVLPKLPETHRFDVDETLSGTRAPLSARMHFLKRHLEPIPTIETWPKLTVSILAHHLGLQKRTIRTYRHLEQGAHAREEILGALSDQRDVFIYERDLHKLGNSLSAFDAFICAYTALLSGHELCAKAPPGFPVSSGWVEYPRW